MTINSIYIKDEIFMLCSFKFIKNTRKYQSRYVKERTKYTTPNDTDYKNITWKNIKWLVNYKNHDINVYINNICIYGNLEVLKLMYANNIELNLNNLICIAVCNNKIEIVKYLVSIGADIDSCKSFLLYQSYVYKNLEMSKYLLSIGGDVTEPIKGIFNQEELKLYNTLFLNWIKNGHIIQKQIQN